MRRTTLCYIEQEDRYLMLHRISKKNDPNRDKWIGVGGGFEPGETDEMCLLREVREETGLTLTSYRKRAVIRFLSDIYEEEEMHLFTADQWTGEMIECNEGRLEWVKRSHIPSLPIWQGDKIFLKLLDEDAPYFNLRLEYRGDELQAAYLNEKKLVINT